ncbi:MAG: 3-oxoacyl-ACP reductase FabG [Actinomycetota bacterium]|jgi:3-oxoacyl-[acyl-carrier protein] reductase
MLLDGKVAVITGAGGALGAAMAIRFLEEGAKLVLTDVSKPRLEAMLQELNVGARAIAVVADATSSDDTDKIVSEATAAFSTIDVWINNAGLARDATMRKMTVDDFDLVIDVHLKGAWLGTRAAADWMRDHGGGSIINVSSISGKVGNPGQTNYSAAKAGMVGLTKAAAKEVGFAGVRVNAIQPGLINSPMLDEMPEKVQESRLSEIPLGRFGEPTEVADVVVFLASDMSRYMTGTVLEISGGRNL